MGLSSHKRFLFPLLLLFGLVIATQGGCTQDEEKPAETETTQEAEKVASVTGQQLINDKTVDTSRIAADQLPKYIRFDEKQLQYGFKIWIGTCEGCHGYGIAGAPIPMESAAWKNRINKGKPILYQHAIEGFFGPNDTQMPERGGNPELTDDEVKAAVDYMIALATYYIEKN